MKTQKTPPSINSHPQRKLCSLAVAALALTAPFLTACGDDESKRFRTAAIPALEAGLKQVADGLLTGFFELNTPQSDTTKK